VENPMNEPDVTPREREIAALMIQLFPMFMDDTRATTSRYERALSMSVFETPFTWQIWAAQFELAPAPADRDMRFLRQQEKIEAVEGRGNYRLKLNDDNLVPLAARVITARGRLSTTLGNGRPFFMAADVRQFCVAADRLPNDAARYPDPIIQRIVQLLNQRGEISESRTRGQYIFRELPTRRGIPSSFDSDKYRRHFYTNGSGFFTARDRIMNAEFPTIRQAVNNMQSADPQLQAAGQEVWADLIQRGAVYNRDFSSYTAAEQQEFTVEGNWAVDHRQPLALHWLTGAGLGNPGNNVVQNDRKGVAEGSGIGANNLRIMWGPKNSAEQARGGSYVAWVGPDFKSSITEEWGNDFVDVNVKFVPYEIP